MRLPVVLPTAPEDRLPVTSSASPRTPSDRNETTIPLTGRTGAAEQFRKSITPDKHRPDAPRRTSVDTASPRSTNRELPQRSEAGTIPLLVHMPPVDTKPDIGHFSQIGTSVTPSKFSQSAAVSHLVKRPITRKRTKEHTVTEAVPPGSEKYTVKRPAFPTSPSTSGLSVPLIEDSDTVRHNPDTNIIINKKKWAKILPRPSTSIKSDASNVSAAETTFSNMLLSSSVPNLYGATLVSSTSPAYIVTAPQPKSNTNTRPITQQTSSSLNTNQTNHSPQTIPKHSNKTTCYYRDIRHAFPNWGVCLDRIPKGTQSHTVKRPTKIVPKPTPDIPISSPCVLPSAVPVNSLPSGNENVSEASSNKYIQSSQRLVSRLPDLPYAPLIAETRKKIKIHETSPGPSISRRIKSESPRAERLKLALKYLDEATEDEEKLYFNDDVANNSQSRPSSDTAKNLGIAKVVAGEVHRKRKRKRKATSPRRRSQNHHSTPETSINHQTVVNTTSESIQTQMNHAKLGENCQSVVGNTTQIDNTNLFQDETVSTEDISVPNNHSSVLAPPIQSATNSAVTTNTSHKKDFSENTNANILPLHAIKTEHSHLTSMADFGQLNTRDHHLLQENDTVPENVKQLYDNAKELVEQVGLYRMSLIQNHELFAPAKKPFKVNPVKQEKYHSEESTDGMKHERVTEINDMQIKQEKRDDAFESIAKVDPNHIDGQVKAGSKRNKSDIKPVLSNNTGMAGHSSSIANNVDAGKGKLAQNPIVLLERCIPLTTEQNQTPSLIKTERQSPPSGKVLDTGNAKQMKRPIKYIPAQKQHPCQKNVGNDGVEKVKLEQYPNCSDKGILFGTRTDCKMSKCITANNAPPICSSRAVSNAYPASSQHFGLQLNESRVTLRILPSSISVHDNKPVPITSLQIATTENENNKDKRFNTNKKDEISINSKSNPMKVQSPSLAPALKKSVPVPVSSTLSRQDSPINLSKNPFTTKSTKTVAEMLKEKRSKETERNCKQVKMPVQLYGMAVNGGPSNAKDKCSNRKKGKTQTVDVQNSPTIAACSNDLDHCYIRRSNQLYSQIGDNRLLGNAISKTTSMGMASNMLMHPIKMENGQQPQTLPIDRRKNQGNHRGQQQYTSQTTVINAMMFPIGEVVSSFNSNALSKNGNRPGTKQTQQDMRKTSTVPVDAQPSTSGCRKIKTEPTKTVAEMLKEKRSKENEIKQIHQRQSMAANFGLKRKRDSQKSQSKHIKLSQEQKPQISNAENRSPFQPLIIVSKEDSNNSVKRNTKSIKTFIGALGLKPVDKVRRHSRNKCSEQTLSSLMSVLAGPPGVNTKKPALAQGVKSKSMKAATMTIIKDSRGECRYCIQLTDIELINDLDSMYHRWFENSDFPCKLHFTDNGGIRQIDVETLRKGLFLVTESSKDLQLDVSNNVPNSSHALLAQYPGYIAAVPNASMAIVVGELFQTEENALFCLQNALSNANSAEDILDNLLGFETNESEPDFTDRRYGSVTNRNMSPKWHSPRFYTNEMHSYYSQAPGKINDCSSTNSLINTKMLKTQSRPAKTLKTQSKSAQPQGLASLKSKSNPRVPAHCEKAMALKQKQNELIAICRKLQHERETRTKVEETVCVDVDSDDEDGDDDDDEVIIVDGNTGWEHTAGMPVMEVLPMARGVNYLRGNTNNNDCDLV